MSFLAATSTKRLFTRSSLPTRQMRVPVIVSRRIAPKCGTPPPSRGAKKVRAAPVPAATAARCGVAVAGSSRTPLKKISARRSTRRCSAPVWQRQDRLIVVDGLSIDAPKTKLFSQKLKGMGLDGGNLLVITDALDENLYLSSRNLPNVLVLEAQEADPVSLVRFAKVLVTKNAVAKFEEMWG